MQKIFQILQTKYPAIIWTVIIFTLCSLPSKELPEHGTSDKFDHFAAFAIWSFLWLFNGSKSLWVILSGIAFGLLIEFWQKNLPVEFNRSFDLFDALADSIGVLLGFGVYVVFTRFQSKFNKA
ncbi:VanZ like family protein [Pseudarcicella hirudinis]|uniref:VanZ like family protein n=1 Tax=Pseudarcicella hirudinis TaxID=1079859 RepID=A0A1I5PJQ2_9BACT|nr:VanZ family protein [Pseudarcicella hirudinis]SFP34259.1 VanZ like family protein [Pseudarcicella hirudinis]